IALGISMTVNWLSEIKQFYGMMLALIMFLGVSYIFICSMFDPLKVYISTTIFLFMINPMILIGRISEYIGGVGAGKFYLGVSHVSLLLGLISYFICKFKYPERQLFGFGKHEIYLLIFTCLTIISAVIAPYKAASYSQLNLYLTLFALYILWSNSLKHIDRNKLINLILVTFSLIAILQLCISLMQILKGMQLGIQFLGEGEVFPRQGTPFPSITGTFMHPGPLSLFFIICMSLFFPFVLQKHNFLTVIGFFSAMIGLVLTFSRTSLLISVVILFLEWFLMKVVSKGLSMKRVFLIAAVILLIIVIFRGNITSRFLNLENASTDNQVENRLVHYQMAWDYIQRKPLFGYGLNNWSYVSKQLQLSTVPGSNIFHYNNPVHNIYLYLWFEGGIILLAGFLFVVISSIISLLKKIRVGNDFEIGLYTSILCVLMYGFTGWGLFNSGQMLYGFYFILALSGLKTVSDL
ncbi:MAG TPA: O-antigen ligase family protein, partial [Bacilli bacterium]